MGRKLNRSASFGQVYPPENGVCFEQDGLSFDAMGDEIVTRSRARAAESTVTPAVEGALAPKKSGRPKKDAPAVEGALAEPEVAVAGTAPDPAADQLSAQLSGS